ncbi:Ribosomal protein L26/L24P, eukaryotic/archaeal [Carpediemonas membranifera]|uniref:Ribosomal protein L26/L24P, eukaryotic/archaeal n=1 Tax=Carpediemonas membranifera TaxID=201153 RepID=A0A8J6E008_9EUKA|nr:Ribosomal protein L26/L24P, eukaryotic/archaeal [Carpediemonas membranifera]|eukprot:KAG9394389.1 Ribosomal protein L26/L24P, eukaryotic/archaeal [Carpediemonas membranifera]
MKFAENVSSSIRKCRKAHFTAPAHERRIIMSSALCEELKKKHRVNALPVRKDDEVKIMRGAHKGVTGVVSRVNRDKFAIFVDKVQREKNNRQVVQIPINASNVMIMKLKMNGSRQRILTRKALPE